MYLAGPAGESSKPAASVDPAPAKNQKEKPKKEPKEKKSDGGGGAKKPAAGGDLPVHVGR